MIKTLTAVCLASMLVTPALRAGEMNHEHPAAPKGSAELERLKGLAGTWEGKTEKNKEGMTVVTYAITGGGSAVEEKIMPGTPMEMTTVYYDEGGKLAMTHYCSLGNHPSMKLMKSEPAKLEFSLVDGTVPAQSMHMHQLAISTPDADHLTADWTLFDKGAKKDVHSFALTRKKG